MAEADNCVSGGRIGFFHDFGNHGNDITQSAYSLEGFRLHCAVSQIRLQLHNHVDSINGVDVKVLVKTSFRSDLLGRNIEFVGKDFGKSGVDLLFLRRKSRYGI